MRLDHGKSVAIVCAWHNTNIGRIITSRRTLEGGILVLSTLSYVLFSLSVNFTDAFIAYQTKSRVKQSALLGNCMDEIYPPSEVAQRNAVSRKDGYWPFVAKNEIPPQDLVYGEFPLDFFQELVTIAISISASCPGGMCKDAEFVDLGAGSGRLVLAAGSSVNHWRKCRGIEILLSLHELSLEKLSYAAKFPEFITAKQIEFENADWGSPDLDLSTADVVFSYTTALQSSDGSVLQELTEAISSKLRSGCVVITTDYVLGDGFNLVASKDGRNDGAGGDCTGYVFLKQ
jgi:hypothetical protein